MKRTIGLLGLLMMGFVQEGLAQEQHLDVQVEDVAGRNVYLNVGRGAGFQVPDTLQVLKGDMPLGFLRVVSISSNRTVTTFVQEPLNLVRGDSIQLVFMGHNVPGQDPDAALEQADQARNGRTSLFERSSARNNEALQPRSVEVNGRIALGFNLIQSKTRGLAAGSPEIKRTFQTPFTNLRLSVDQLPYDLRAQVNFRLAHRRASLQGIDPETSFRMYQVNIERDIPETPLVFQVGRFSNRAESFSGFWDGAALGYRIGRVQLGTAFGIQPDRANEGLSTSLPKYTVYTSYTFRQEATQYDADVSFHEVRPTNQLLNHTYFGFAQSLRWEKYRLRTITQLDRNPESGGWVMSRIQLYGSMPLGSRLSLRVRYVMRQPYQLWRTEQVIGYQRDRTSVGMTVNLFRGSISADVISNHTDREGQSYTYSSYMQFSDIGIWEMGLNAAVNYWSRDGQSVLYFAPGLSRAFGRVYTQIRYRYDDSRFEGYETVRHSFESLINMSLTRRIRSSLLVGTQRGDQMSQLRMFASLWIRI